MWAYLRKNLLQKKIVTTAFLLTEINFDPKKTKKKLFQLK